MKRMVCVLLSLLSVTVNLYAEEPKPSDANVATATKNQERNISHREVVEPFLKKFYGYHSTGAIHSESIPQSSIEVLRSDVGHPSINHSNWGTPLQVGGVVYTRGIGTHCVSEFALRLAKPGKTFDAYVGLDDNSTILGRGGVVRFSVEIDGESIYNSGPCRRGEKAIHVQVDLKGAQEFVLKVSEETIGYNHADWIDPVVTLEDGSVERVEDMLFIHQPQFTIETPFSFSYGGKPSAHFLSTWICTRTEKQADAGKKRYDIVYTDPITGLEITCEQTLYKKSKAIEWVLYFENKSGKNTPIIKDLQALDLGVKIPVGKQAVLHTILGSSASGQDYLPVSYPTPPGRELALFPAAGLSSKGVPAGQPGGQMPFFNFEWEGGGLAGAIGWSGQWEMSINRGAKARSPLEDQRPLSAKQKTELRAFVMSERAKQPDLYYRLAAGQQTTHFTLHPGEKIRSPRILLVPWEGTQSIDGNNRLRKVLLDHYSPRRNGKLLIPPLSAMAMENGQEFTSTNTQNQLQAMEKMEALGMEAYWHDTAWFSGGFPGGIGNWTHDVTRFPEGLSPLGKAARDRGMDFVLWFDTERVMPDSETAREHPEWLLRSDASASLFNLGNPDALDWLEGHISKCIDDWGITIFRQDMTIHPLPYWQANEAEDRQGINEIRHIENLYALWDRLRERHPGLAIDNCAGGGCRVDLETMKRSWPLWRSDSQIFGRSNATWNQAQTAGLNLFVPFHAAGMWSLDPYNARSTGTMGGVTLLDINGDEFPMNAARRMIEEVKMLRPYWLGDYYPLTEINVDEGQWCAWQFHRPDLDSGYCILFRRAESPFPAMELRLQGIDPVANYQVRYIDSHEERTMTGAELVGLSIAIDTPAKSALLVYSKIK